MGISEMERSEKEKKSISEIKGEEKEKEPAKKETGKAEAEQDNPFTRDGYRCRVPDFPELVEKVSNICMCVCSCLTTGLKERHCPLFGV